MDPKDRFSTRVENYIRYRPGYPQEVIEVLQKQCGLSMASVVADIGSGTGLLTRLFLEAGCHVIGVEPNAEMRTAGERLLAGYPRFTSWDGSAEHTGLQDASVDLITAGQAFHWFRPQVAREEFLRILRPGGWVALVWNERLVDDTPFLRAYEALLQQYATDYNQVNHRNVEESPDIIPAFFGGAYRRARFNNAQVFDFEGVQGRLLSSSYAPEAGQPALAPMLSALRQVFDQFQQNGVVTFAYQTVLFFGQLS